MGAKITFSVLLALTVLAAPLPASARTCILSNTASDKACKMACCANMSCCAMSQNNTVPATPPLAKSADQSDSNLILAPAAAATIAVLDFPSFKANISLADFSAHSPPILALNCALLI